MFSNVNFPNSDITSQRCRVDYYTRIHSLHPNVCTVNNRILIKKTGEIQADKYWYHLEVFGYARENNVGFQGYRRNLNKKRYIFGVSISITIFKLLSQFQPDHFYYIPK
jgi:hypothetical protein